MVAAAGDLGTPRDTIAVADRRFQLVRPAALAARRSIRSAGAVRKLTVGGTRNP
jgi:hypothetical protein